MATSATRQVSTRGKFVRVLFLKTSSSFFIQGLTNLTKIWLKFCFCSIAKGWNTTFFPRFRTKLMHFLSDLRKDDRLLEYRSKSATIVRPYTPIPSRTTRRRISWGWRAIGQGRGDGRESDRRRWLWGGNDSIKFIFMFFLKYSHSYL